MCLIILMGDAFAGYEELARELRDWIGCRLIEDQVLIEWAAARGPSHRDLRAALDAPPRLWDGLRGRRAACKKLLAQGLLAEASQGVSVYSGMAGYLVRKAPVRLLRVRVTAPFGRRIAEAGRRLAIPPAEAARLIRRMDRAQRRRTRFAAADLHIDLGEIDGAQACRLIVAAVTAPLEARSRALPNRRRRTLAAAACVALAAVFARPEIGFRTLTGTITDTRCRSGHTGESRLQAECVRACVRDGPGVAYALHAGRRLYVLDDRRTPEPFAARQVRVTGVVNRFGFMRVKDISEVPHLGHARLN